MPATKCDHEKTKQYCQICSPYNFCEHNIRKSRYKQCCGIEICEHSKRRYYCKECKGPGWCQEHDCRKSNCKLCKGGSICEHNQHKSQCKKCYILGIGGSSRCEHNQVRTRCDICGGGSNCIHNKRRSLCRECLKLGLGGGELCEHGNQKQHCRECDPSVSERDKLKWAINFSTSMVNASIKSDKRSNRLYEKEHYITKEWIHETLEIQQNLCIYCSCLMLFGEGVCRTDPNGLTIERKDNQLAHIKENCVLACARCNHLSQNIPQMIMTNSEYAPNLKAGILRWCPGKDHGTEPEDHVRPIEEFGKVIDSCRACQRAYSKNRRATKKQKLLEENE